MTAATRLVIVCNPNNPTATALTPATIDALVRLAQEWNLRHPLIDGQGNFGSIDGDSAAAYRYTEARLTRLAEMMLADIDKDTVDFGPNFDDATTEPLVLPTRFPNLLVNGSAGIAVGMATNIPPHNLGEVIESVVHLIDHPEAPLGQLLDPKLGGTLPGGIQGPDFPTGGILMGIAPIRVLYETAARSCACARRSRWRPTSAPTASASWSPRCRTRSTRRGRSRRSPTW